MFGLLKSITVLSSVVKLERKEIPEVKLEKKEATKKPNTQKRAMDDNLPKLSAFEQKRLQNLRDNQEMVSFMSIYPMTLKAASTNCSSGIILRKFDEPNLIILYFFSWHSCW